MPLALRLFALLPFLAAAVFMPWFDVTYQPWRGGGFVNWIEQAILPPVILLVWFGMFCTAFFRPRLVMTEDELELRDWFKTKRVRLADIVDAQVNPGGTVFLLNRGSTVGTSVLQKGVGAQLFRMHTRTDRIVGMILAAAQAQREALDSGQHGAPTSP